MCRLNISLAFLATLLVSSSSSLAMGPGFISDQELSESPVIVLAKWEKAPFISHHKLEHEGTVLREFELHTKLKVLRVIRGKDLGAGEHELMVGMGISWNDDGTNLRTGTSTDLLGVVNDVTKPNLWFLGRERSWDAARQGEYLAIRHYLKVQPAEFEAYFRALASDRPEVEVPRLLKPEQPAVARRVLQYISGGIFPWPYDPDKILRSYLHPATRGKVLEHEAPNVWALVNSKAENVRHLATAVYADLRGRGGIGAYRSLLVDRDPLVRGVAVGVLARHRDADSLGKMREALRGLDDAALTCRLIGAFSDWGDERVTLLLIASLQNNKLVYVDGDDMGVPAFKAHQALKKITGHWFPFDVARSEAAWERVSKVTDKVQRQEALQRLIPGYEFPLQAELVRGRPVKKGDFEEIPGRARSQEDSDYRIVTIRIRNVTSDALTLATTPWSVEFAWPGGLTSYGHSGLTGRERQPSVPFVTIPKGGSHELEVKLDEELFIAEPADRKIEIVYLKNGSEVGVKAWIGRLSVKPGAEWKETRLVKQVEETWPNGNLKVVGKTVNGREVGEWNYFNEQGDRIAIKNYRTFRAGNAECNANHPENKGAGKRAKKP